MPTFHEFMGSYVNLSAVAFVVPTGGGVTVFLVNGHQHGLTGEAAQAFLALVRSTVPPPAPPSHADLSHPTEVQ